MAALTNCSAITTAINPTLKPHRPTNSLLSPNFFKPISSSNTYPILSSSRSLLRKPYKPYRLAVVSGLVEGNSETYPNEKPGDSDATCPDEAKNGKGATVDLKLPRRSLLVQFTCDACGERTQRLINRLAYERGLVYVQCAGCERYHKFADNLGLIVEYDLREENSTDPNTDQV